VDKASIIADGFFPSTDLGELRLGRNVLVACMPWEGYNFEDSILLSDLFLYGGFVKTDVFTSIQSRNSGDGAADTKLAFPSEINRDIPNVSEEAMKEPRRSRIVYYRRGSSPPATSWSARSRRRAKARMTPERGRKEEEKMLARYLSAKRPPTCDDHHRCACLRRQEQPSSKWPRLQPDTLDIGDGAARWRSNGKRSSVCQGPAGRRAGYSQTDNGYEPSGGAFWKSQRHRRFLFSEGLKKDNKITRPWRRARRGIRAPLTCPMRGCLASPTDKLMAEIDTGACGSSDDESKKGLEPAFLDKVEMKAAAWRRIAARRDEDWSKVFVAVKRQDSAPPARQDAAPVSNKPRVVSKIVRFEKAIP